MKAQASQAFVVSPPSAHAWMLLVALGGVLPLGIIAALRFSGHPMAGALPALLVVPLVLAILLLAMKRRAVELRDGMLDIRAAMYRKCVATAELDLQRARIVAEKSGLDTYAAFRAVMDRRGEAWASWPERLRDGKNQLLLSLQQPQALLDALREPNR